MVEDSKNPFDDFNAVSRSMGVPPEYLDFDILEIYTSYKNFSKRPFWRCGCLKAGRHKKEKVKVLLDFFGNVWYNIYRK